MLRYGLAGALLLVFTASSSPLRAQTFRTEPPPPDSVKTGTPLGGHQVRQGLWLGAGLGYGSLENGRSMGGLTGKLEGGWTLSRRVALGLGTSVWSRDMGRLGATIGSVDLRVRWYPSEQAGGLFFTGAYGLGFIRLSDPEARPSSSTATGRAFSAGLGYDIRAAQGVSITPFATGAKVNTYTDGDHMWGEVWQLGVGVTIH